MTIKEKLEQLRRSEIKNAESINRWLCGTEGKK